MIQFYRILTRVSLLFTLILLIQNRHIAGDPKLTAIFYGDWGKSMYEIDNIQSWTGKRPAILVHFTAWCPDTIDVLFDFELMNMWTNHTVPLLTWELFPCYGHTLPGITKLVHNGTYDAYINQFSDRMKNWLAGNDGIYGNADDRRLYIRFAHEMNGFWYPWSQNSTPTDYILAWRHVHDMLTNKGLDSTHVQWVWCVTSGDPSSYVFEQYWVGDNYTDWLAVDGYNWGRSQSWGSIWTWPNEIFDNTLARLRNLSSTKPISIPEYGSTSFYYVNGSSIPYKNEWLNVFCFYIDYMQIKFASYFNIEKETDWSIFGGSRGDTVWNNISAYSAYKNCLQSNDWIQPNSTNPRLLTDDQFAGRF